MIALQEDEKLRAPLQLLRTPFITIGQRRDHRGIQLGKGALKRCLYFRECFRGIDLDVLDLQ